MNPIKQFFAKRKAEKKFEKAGPGHKLADNSTSSPSSQGKRECGHRNQRGEGVQKAGAATIVPQYPRGEGVQRAAAAALARVERTKPTEVNWSLSALRAQARKELSLESQASENAKVGPKEIVTDSAPVLSVSGVYFSSPFTGPAVLPRQEIEAKIKEFLYEQLEAERGLTACLIIHTCNKNKEKVRLGVETICRYLTNIIDNPTEEKYRKIRINNKAFQDRVSNLEGAHDLLMATGFKRISLPNGDTEEDFYVFPEEELSNIENVQMLKEALFGTEPIYPTLDRNTRVLMPSQASEKINLPSDFFNITVDEIVKEHEARVEAADLETQLRTKAMRERDSIKELRTYRYSLVRLRLPDGIILQGTFNVRERLSAVKDFVAENAADPNREFQLLAPGGFKLTEYDSTLAELKLVPAVILNLTWSDDDDDNGTHGEETAYLKSETMALLQTL